MITTPFPVRPRDVVSLTVQEFTCELDVNATPSIDFVCRRFLYDANRALVWLIRFKALQAWSVREDTTEWLLSGTGHLQHASELAASFTLNGEWEFDAEDFRSAVQSQMFRKSASLNTPS
jgi:hypothetical protein